MVTSPNSSRRSSTFQITQRTGARPMPPAMKTTSLPFQSSTGNQLPYGPRKPTVSPTFTSRSAAVTLPTALKLHSIKPLRVGALAIQKVLSPAPNTLYSPCLLYTSDAADDLLCVDLGGRRIIKK